MADVKIYVKPGCPYCEAAREYYTQQRVAFEEVNIIGNPEAQKELLKLSKGKRMVPVIVDKGQVKVGWDGG
jgi:glutaredoxin 3